MLMKSKVGHTHRIKCLNDDQEILKFWNHLGDIMKISYKMYNICRAASQKICFYWKSSLKTVFLLNTFGNQIRLCDIHNAPRLKLQYIQVI